MPCNNRGCYRLFNVENSICEHAATKDAPFARGERGVRSLFSFLYSGLLPASSLTAAVTTAVIAATKFAARALFHRACFVYRKRSSAEVLPIHELDCLLCFLIGRHFYKAETL